MANLNSLELKNPGTDKEPYNVIYSGEDNSLELEISTESPYGIVLEKSSGINLKMVISGGILDETSAKKLIISRDWSIASYEIKDGQAVFQITPPTEASKGTIIKGTPLIITLSNITPVQNSSGSLFLEYDTPDNKLDVSNQLTVITESKGISLFGIGNALAEPVIEINPYNGYQEEKVVEQDLATEGTPLLVVDAGPEGITEENLINNIIKVTIRLNWNQGLVEEWSGQPYFRIFFPYLTIDGALRADMDLTDNFVEGQSGYNELSTAWRILCSFDEKDDKKTDNEYWEITRNERLKNDIPYWDIKPKKKKNKNIFTPSGLPGPQLTFYFHKVSSSLPVSDVNSTLMYFQWNDFPGFKSGISTFNIKKLKIPHIDSFLGYPMYMDKNDISVYGNNSVVTWDVAPVPESRDVLMKLEVPGKSVISFPNAFKHTLKIDSNPINNKEGDYILGVYYNNYKIYSKGINIGRVLNPLGLPVTGSSQFENANIITAQNGSFLYSIHNPENTVLETNDAYSWKIPEYASSVNKIRLITGIDSMVNSGTPPANLKTIPIGYLSIPGSAVADIMLYGTLQFAYFMDNREIVERGLFEIPMDDDESIITPIPRGNPVVTCEIDTNNAYAAFRKQDDTIGVVKITNQNGMLTYVDCKWNVQGVFTSQQPSMVYVPDIKKYFVFYIDRDTKFIKYSRTDNPDDMNRWEVSQTLIDQETRNMNAVMFKDAVFLSFNI